MQTALENKLTALLEPAVEGLGLELVRIKVIGSSKPTIQVMAEKPDHTMAVDECARLSREISAILDVEDPMAGKYVLEVSSPGLDRPLTRIKDFEDFEGYEAKIETRAPIEGQRRFKGRLQGIKDERITIATPEGEKTLAFGDIEKAKLVLTDELIAESLKGQHG